MKKYLINAGIMAALLSVLIYQVGCGGKVIDNTRELRSMVLTPDEPTVTAGGKLNFTAVGIDQKGEKLFVSPVWEAHEGTVDSAGVYIAPGYKTIDRVTAFVNGIMATSVVSVEPLSEAEKIEIHFQNKFIPVGTSVKFYAIGKNKYGEEVTVKVAWTCLYGKIEQDGTYTAPIHTCHEAITAKSVSSTGVLPVDISPGGVQKIFIYPATTTVRALNGIKFTYQAYDQYNNAVDSQPRFFSRRGKVTDDGYYVAPLQTGSDEVAIVHNFVGDTASIEIIP